MWQSQEAVQSQRSVYPLARVPLVGHSLIPLPRPFPSSQLTQPTTHALIHSPTPGNQPNYPTIHPLTQPLPTNPPTRPPTHSSSTHPPPLANHPTHPPTQSLTHFSPTHPSDWINTRPTSADFECRDKRKMKALSQYSCSWQTLFY